jgi:hypothetical protein
VVWETAPVGIVIGDAAGAASVAISLASFAVSVVALRMARRDRTVDLTGKALSELSEAFKGYVPVLKYRQARRAYHMAYFLYDEDHSLARPTEPTPPPQVQTEQATFAIERVIHGRVEKQYHRALRADAAWDERFRTLETPASSATFFRQDITPEEFQAVAAAAGEADNADETLLYVMRLTAQAPPVLTTGNTPRKAEGDG